MCLCWGPQHTHSGACENNSPARPPLKLYYHGEPLNVNVHVTNNSTKTVKKIKVSGRKWGLEGDLGEGVAARGAPGDISVQGHNPVWETHLGSKNLGCLRVRYRPWCLPLRGGRV